MWPVQISEKTCCGYDMSEKSREGMKSEEDLGGEDLSGSELRSLKSDRTRGGSV